eukprot:TRINITY_DN37401_c0_g1_i1.p1 TRINITY_DN37401_c0_g1~~TRINITY_DN37401_c0_g1_i1.p1  ORF type:complete len:511 (+),score=87.32 TRINITY_DN37401_c0_g1_i1:59-1534(+)
MIVATCLTVLVCGVSLPEVPQLALEEILFEESGVAVPWDEGRVSVYRGAGSTWGDILDKNALFDLLQNTDSVHATHSRLLPEQDIDIVKTFRNQTTSRNPPNAVTNPIDSFKTMQYSIILHDLEKRQTRAHKKSHFLSEAFICPVSISVVITPPDSQGLGKHVHKHDIFVIQISGAKSWQVYDVPESKVLPRRDQVTERFATPDSDDNFKKIEEINLREGNVLYLPRGVPVQADTTDLDEESLHLTVSLECSESRHIWEDLVHHIINVGCSQQDDIGLERGEHNFCSIKLRELEHDQELQVDDSDEVTLSHWHITNKALFHSIVRVASNTKIPLRKSIVGMQTSDMVRYYSKYIIPVLQSISQGLLPDDCSSVDLHETRLLTWIKTGIKITDVQGSAIPVGIEDPSLHHAVSLLHSQVTDFVSETTLREVSESRNLFWQAFLVIISDPEFIEVAAEQMRNLRLAAFNKQQVESRDHLKRQQLRDGDHDIFW